VSCRSTWRPCRRQSRRRSRGRCDRSSSSTPTSSTRCTSTTSRSSSTRTRTRCRRTSRRSSYVHLDFTEKEFYKEDIFPLSERVRYLATGFDVFTVVRVYFGDEGLFLSLDRGEPVEPVVDAVESVYEDTE